jgi:hypothetical protein
MVIIVAAIVPSPVDRAMRKNPRLMNIRNERMTVVGMENPLCCIRCIVVTYESFNSPRTRMKYTPRSIMTSREIIRTKPRCRLI